MMEDNFKYHGMYRAKVLATDVLEDDNIGRLKLEIYPMLISSDANGSAAKLRANGSNIEGIALADLPWAAPAMGLFAGSGDGYGSFVLPEVGSFVWIFFESGDAYQPVYFAEATTKTKGIPSESAVGYPYAKVWKTKSGIVISINDEAKTVKIEHPEGAKILINGTSDITIIGTNVRINP